MTRHKRLFSPLSEHVGVQSKASGVGRAPTLSLTAESLKKHASEPLLKLQASLHEAIHVEEIAVVLFCARWRTHQ